MAESRNTGILFQPGIDTEDEVLKIRARAKELFMEGKTVLQWQGEGVSANKQFVMDVSDVLVETRLFLMRINPTKYGNLTNSARQLRF